MWKETYERGPYTSNHPCAEVPCTCQKQDYESEKRPMKEAYTYQIADALRCHVHVTTRIMNVKRDLSKRPIQFKKTIVKKWSMNVKRGLWMWEEDYECRKRPIQEANTNKKDTNEKLDRECEKRTMNVKRDLYKRPIQIKNTLMKKNNSPSCEPEKPRISVCLGLLWRLFTYMSF